MKKQPLYLKLYSQIRDLIKSGELKPGLRISHRTIAEQYNTSKKTASEALAMLEAEGLVYSEPRSGTVVSNNAWQLLSGDNTPEWQNYVESGFQLPSKEKIFTFFRDLSSGREIHISGPRVGKDFAYANTIAKAMPHVIKRIQDSNDLNYTGIKGLHSLRVTLCEYMSKYGIKVTPDEIMVTAGMTESLAIISWAFLRGGMTFIHDTPSILNSMQLIRSSGTNIVKIPLDEFGMMTEPLSKALKNSDRNMLYVNPVNQYPTGISYSKARRDKILSICKYAGAPIVENDMLREFWLDKPHPKPMKAFDKGGHVIYVGSLIGVNVGLKLSWIIAPKNILQRLSDVKTQYDVNTNTFNQIVADELIKNGYYEAFLETSRPLFRSTLEKAYDIIEKHMAGLILPFKRHYSYYIWLTFIGEIDILKVYESKQDIMFLPGYFFDNSDHNGLHLAPFADSIDNFEKAIKSIAEAAKLQLS